MARGPSTRPSRQSRKTPAKKRPARAKRPAATAPARGTRKKTSARKAATAPAKKAAGRKASKVKGKPKTASTASHKGASKARLKKGAAKDATRGATGGRVTVENVNVPGYKNTVDAGKYHATRGALLAVLPKRAPGMTQDEMGKAVGARLTGDLAAKAMWWVKTVQLDLEAKKRLVREATMPLRWHLA